MKPTSPHQCPHCQCRFTDYHGLGHVNKKAPGYPTVILIDSYLGAKCRASAERARQHQQRVKESAA